ncbi:MAG: Helix-turn-helix domain [Symbiobacteriaceae bacterium]|jgi:transcriptional regulator with XRE-family HTH domain|nr:Helix-turn-helix domain [Symbiobacteriaceae bacterium]
MTEGLGSRLARLRTERGLAGRELAIMTGIPYGDLVALEAGNRRRLQADTTRKLAEFFGTTPDYLLDGQEPAPATLRTGFLRYYGSLPSEERERLKFAPIQGRMAAVLRFLQQSYPTLLDRPQVAARLGYSPEALDDVLRGAAPLQSRLLKLLSGLVGLSTDFLVRGDFFGGAVESEHSMSPEVLSQYYQVVQEAIAAGISPAALRKAVHILAIRDQEE